MGIRLWKWMGFPAACSLLLFSACDQHSVGEDAEVQKEHILPAGAKKAGEAEAAPEQSPAAKATPAEFFPSPSPSPNNP